MFTISELDAHNKMSSYKRFPQIKNVPANVCSISLNKYDRIRLNGLPADVINSIRRAISQSWGRIQNEAYHHGAYEFKLKGTPWRARGKEVVKCRRVMAAILTTMAQFGWNLLQAAGISEKLGSMNMDTLFFEKGMPDPDVALVTMSLEMSDRIRIIDAPSFAECVTDAIHSQWPKGIQSTRDYHGSIKFKLSGNPWHSNGSESACGMMLMCQIISNMKKKGYKLYGAFNVCNFEWYTPQLDSCSVFRRMNHCWS